MQAHVKLRTEAVAAAALLIALIFPAVLWLKWLVGILAVICLVVAVFSRPIAEYRARLAGVAREAGGDTAPRAERFLDAFNRENECLMDMTETARRLRVTEPTAARWLLHAREAGFIQDYGSSPGLSATGQKAWRERREANAARERAEGM